MKLLLLLCVLASQAQAIERRPHCPDSSTPRFSGHPFLPFMCPGMNTLPSGSGAELLTAQTRPLQAKPAPTGFEDMAGNWEGWAIYGMNRFQVVAKVALEGSRVRVKLAAQDHATLVNNRFAVEFKKSLWHAGRWNVSARELDLSDRVSGEAWLGAAPPPVAQGLSRSFVLVYDRLAVLHEVRFTLAGPDRIVYSYVFRRKDGDPVEMSGTLVRSKREPY